MSVIEITSENFAQEVIKSQKPVLIDFWASWCQPCRMVAPVIEEIALERDDIKVCKINVDDQRTLAEDFNVMSIPTLVAMRDGKIINTAVGMRPKNSIIEMFG